ncbi:hypothetical protein G8T60_12040 [Clostridium botulinum C]|uniref:hypothetical protein n=1 Tax=Clostridium botulinum TaxID=1491 RepID=UPI001E4A080C|nr:hypothetical protein [Clostridium botulinum]MCD3206787.1 hypothetical protein [Clostridium botulinum C]MCD3209558.1 hypothetical protein [Clostridium botulinum C]MCD3226587.1 hypothetical protein [Clostridium botulinum C]MCD3249020.1 hypothetical protein [Clostridium botulinum C]MCD3257449.1 hypothetical protein [Clostridium botulinum C]
MRILAYVGLVIEILNVIIKLKSTFTEKEISDRVSQFIGLLINGSLVYFFFIYLFR